MKMIWAMKTKTISTLLILSRIFDLSIPDPGVHPGLFFRHWQGVVTPKHRIYAKLYMKSLYLEEICP